jgi:hypothetical protein
VRLRRRVKPVVAGGRHEEFDKRPACVRRHLIGVRICCARGAYGNGEGTQHGASARKQRELRHTGHEVVTITQKKEMKRALAGTCNSKATISTYQHLPRLDRWSNHEVYRSRT